MLENFFHTLLSERNTTGEWFELEETERIALEDLFLSNDQSPTKVYVDEIPDDEEGKKEVLLNRGFVSDAELKEAMKSNCG